MNFISEVEGREVQVELKYCERCGGLWLRPQGADGVYCSGCQARLAARPDPGEAPPRKARSRKARLPGTGGQPQGPAIPGRIDSLQGVAATEVQA